MENKNADKNICKIYYKHNPLHEIQVALFGDFRFYKKIFTYLNINTHCIRKTSKLSKKKHHH